MTQRRSARISAYEVLRIKARCKIFRRKISEPDQRMTISSERIMPSTDRAC